MLVHEINYSYNQSLNHYSNNFININTYTLGPMCMYACNKLYKKAHTLVLGGEASRVKLTTPPKGTRVVLPLVLYDILK